MSGTEDPLPQGLRERKKAKTRALIQQQALRLFREQGYDETSIEQIAETVEVSPSTVRRYFPSKADLVIYDDFDEGLVEAVRAQPPGLSAMQVIREATLSVYSGLQGEELDVQRERERLIRTVPELWAAMLGELTRTLEELAGLIAERAGRAADDDTVQALSGAVIGVGIAAWFGSAGDNWAERFLERFDKGMRLLETGFKV